MIYTTHGLMTGEDYRDHRDLYDLDAWKDDLPDEDEDDEESEQ